MNQLLTRINDALYTYLLLFLLAGAGIYFTIRTRGVQLRLLKDGLRSMLDRPGQDRKKTPDPADGTADSDGDTALDSAAAPDSAASGKVSSFQALMISTASRVGTGNIAGIAAAIVSGGPGAVFWMWIMAVIGSASAFVESTLAQIYKIEENGQFRGGPSYYMEKALGKRWIGILFSISLILCFAYGFNALQAYNMSSALEYYISDYTQTSLPMILGLLLAAATAYVIWGGVHRISFITSILVPFMAVIYILMGLAVMFLHLGELPGILALILKEAFHFRAFSGGLAGSALVIGIKRGLFSNEAGMGSAPNASASAAVDHPVQQGLVQVISVFIDTLLICSSTAMMLLLSGVEGSPQVLDGIPFVQAAIQANVGTWGIHFITFSIYAFAFSSIIGNYYYAESNILFIKNSPVVLHLFRVTCVLVIFLGTQANFTLMWNIADITMGIMALINILTILFLGDIAFRALKNYEAQRKPGLRITFLGKDIGVKDTIWK